MILYIKYISNLKGYFFLPISIEELHPLEYAEIAEHWNKAECGWTHVTCSVPFLSVQRFMF